MQVIITNCWIIKLLKTFFCTSSQKINQWNVHCFTPVGLGIMWVCGWVTLWLTNVSNYFELLSVGLLNLLQYERRVYENQKKTNIRNQSLIFLLSKIKHEKAQLQPAMQDSHPLEIIHKNSFVKSPSCQIPAHSPFARFHEKVSYLVHITYGGVSKRLTSS